jgi:hypothetical protein
MRCPDNPRIVIASRADVLFPSETSTRSGFASCAEAAISDHSRIHLPLSASLTTHIADSGELGEGCHAAVFMDK